MLNSKVLFTFVLFIFSSVFIQAQDSLKASAKTEKETIDTANNKIRVSILPYPFYTNIFKLGVGGFLGVKNMICDNSLLKVGGFITTNSSILGYLQYEELQIPGLDRVFVRPDLLFGKLGKVKNYFDLPFPRAEKFDVYAGANNSSEDNYFEVEGTYQWYDFTVGYLLPIGYGRDNVKAHPKLENGILMGGATGGYSLNPFESGRTFLQAKLTYRRLDMTLMNQKTHQTASGVELTLNVENVDYVWNPTVGYIAKFSYLTDWKALGSDNNFDVFKADVSYYIPFSEKKSKSPTVLALDLKTAHTLNWYKNDGLNKYGKINYTNRPPNFMGAFLGGPKTMRGYMEYRYFDRSSLYYCAELRHILEWNPFNEWSLTRKIGVDWVQVAAFGELGRVAPEWKLKTFHQDMKWDFGAGLRIFMDGFLVRIDMSYGKEGPLLQMFYDYSF